MTATYTQIHSEVLKKLGRISEYFLAAFKSFDVNSLRRQIYHFEEFRLIPDERLLLRDGEAISLPPKVFDTLLLLVENVDHLLEKDQFLDHIWPDSFVEEATLARAISTLRKALGDEEDHRLIETVPKSGYRFVAQVVLGSESEPLVSLEAELQIPETADGTSETESVRRTVSGNESAPARQFSIWSRPVLLLIFSFVVLGGISLLSSWNWDQKRSDDIGSIAVLPFQEIGDVGHDDLLEFGLTDSLITSLSNLKRVAVRPTSAVSEYSGQQPDSVDAGRKLEVDAVVEGSIQRSRGRVRVNVQLISTADGSSLWAEQFETSAADVFTVQDSITQQVVRALALRLGGDSRFLISRGTSENADANRFYLTGRYHWNKRTVADLAKGIEYYEKALEIDPDYALAYSGIADCYQLLAEYLAVFPKEAFPQAKEAAIKALEIDNRLAEAHTSLAYTLAFYDWTSDQAEDEFKRAIELDPNYATAHQWYAELLAAKGRFGEAESEFEKALQLDPTSLIIQSDVASFLYLTRRNDEAIKEARKIVDLDPGFAYAYVVLWLALDKEGLKEEAAKAFITATELFGEKPEANELRTVLERNGIVAMWRRRLRQIDTPTRRKSFSAVWRAMFHLRIGEKQKAIDWFETAYERRERWVVNLKHSPDVDALRDEPRFKALLSEIDP